MSWLEISLNLRPELAEPAAELLGRISRRGVAIESVDDQVRVRGWLADDAELDERRSQIEQGLWHLSQIVPYPEPTYQRIEDEDWESIWKRNYRPLRVGSRLTVQPAWSTDREGGHQTIYLEPGMAFGTGAHPTTQHCLQALEQIVQAGHSVLDLGCGSGILSIAAAVLGAETVLGVDHDLQAVKLARANADLNNLSDRVDVQHGSLNSIPDGSGFDIVVVNILAHVILEMLESGLAKRVEPAGWLILSGLMEGQEEQVLEAARAAGGELSGTWTTNDWRTMVLTKKRRPSD
jgi:ribosomal protein L11 methyltransferase